MPPARSPVPADRHRPVGWRRQHRPEERLAAGVKLHAHSKSEAASTGRRADQKTACPCVAPAAVVRHTLAPMTTTLRACRVAVCAAVLSSCGGSGEPAAGASDSSRRAAAESVGLIAADALARCAGVTTESAADILGTASGELTDYSRTEGELRMCLYRNPDDRSQTVSFTLARRASVEQAAASMGSERETLTMARGAIDNVTRSEPKEPAAEDLSMIGDEAFYSPMNDAIMLRVANVVAQVTDPGDMALKTRVAEVVARGLRQ
jgi:hypothetical protein